MAIGKDRNKDRFKNRQLRGVSKLPLCEHTMIKLTQNYALALSIRVSIFLLHLLSLVIIPPVAQPRICSGWAHQWRCQLL